MPRPLSEPAAATAASIRRARDGARAVAAIVLALTLLSESSAAQRVEPGMRIRITQADGHRRVGEVTLIRPDSALVLAAAGTRFAVPLAKVLAVETSAGTTRRFGEHFAQVVVIGAVAGGLISALGHTFARGDQAEAFARGAAAGAIIAVPLGIVVGRTKGTERWAPLPHPVVSPSPPPAIGRDR